MAAHVSWLSCETTYTMQLFWRYRLNLCFMLWYGCFKRSLSHYASRKAGFTSCAAFIIFSTTVIGIFCLTNYLLSFPRVKLDLACHVFVSAYSSCLMFVQRSVLYLWCLDAPMSCMLFLFCHILVSWSWSKSFCFIRTLTVPEDINTASA